jgi:hypothetical protein
MTEPASLKCDVTGPPKIISSSGGDGESGGDVGSCGGGSTVKVAITREMKLADKLGVA